MSDGACIGKYIDVTPDSQPLLRTLYYYIAWRDFSVCYNSNQRSGTAETCIRVTYVRHTRALLLVQKRLGLLSLLLEPVLGMGEGSSGLPDDSSTTVAIQ